MEIEYFKYIVTVAKYGSISKAAQILYVSQPYLSKVIKDIEAQVMFPIFVRQNNGVYPTARGSQFLLYAQRILNENENIMHLYKSKEDDRNFNLSSVRTCLILDCFLQLLEDYVDEPKMHFSIRENGNNAAINDVYTLKADLGIVYLQASNKESFFKEMAEKSIQYNRVCNFAYYIILSENHPLLQINRPITRDDLYPYGMLRYGSGLLFGSEDADSIWYNSFLDMSRIKRIIDVYDRATMHNLLTCTNFFTLGTNPSVFQRSIHKIISLPIDHISSAESPVAEMGYIYSKSVPMSSITKTFINLLEKDYGIEEKTTA